MELSHKAPRAACINASVEESTISSRDDRFLKFTIMRLLVHVVLCACSLLAQDAFVQANITVRAHCRVPPVRLSICVLFRRTL